MQAWQAFRCGTDRGGYGENVEILQGLRRLEEIADSPQVSAMRFLCGRSAAPKVWHRGLIDMLQVGQAQSIPGESVMRLAPPFLHPVLYECALSTLSDVTSNGRGRVQMGAG